MSRWPMVALGEFCDTRLGKMLDRKRETGLRAKPYLRNVNVQWGRLDLREVLSMDFDDDERQELRLLPGDVLVCEGGEVGRAAIWSSEIEECYFQKALHRVRPQATRCLPKYVYWRFLWMAQSGALREFTSHSTIQHLTGVKLRSISIPLPPLDEQRRIVDLLDRAAGIRRRREQALAKARSIIPALFLDMFGDPASNPKGWRTAAFGDLIDRLEGGKNIQAGDGEASSLRILKISAVTSGRFRPSESKAAPAGYVPPQSHFVRAGDLLITRANTADLFGAVAEVNGAYDNLLLPDKIWRFVWRQPSPIVQAFMGTLLAMPAVRMELKRLATGTSDSMRNISQAKLLRLKLPVPSLDIQQCFAGRLADLQSVITQQERALAAARALECSLMVRLLG